MIGSGGPLGCCMVKKACTCRDRGQKTSLKVHQIQPCYIMLAQKAALTTHGPGGAGICTATRRNSYAMNKLMPSSMGRPILQIQCSTCECA
jgi:hypothetical protein